MSFASAPEHPIVAILFSELVIVVQSAKDDDDFSADGQRNCSPDLRCNCRVDVSSDQPSSSKTKSD